MKTEVMMGNNEVMVDLVFLSSNFLNSFKRLLILFIYLSVYDAKSFSHGK